MNCLECFLLDDIMDIIQGTVKLLIGGFFMKVSTKGRYALRFLINIASRQDGKPVSIKDVSAQEDISEKYLEQITSVLNSGGIVKSIRGPQGGYLLKKQPKDITVGMVLRLTEGGLAPVACLDADEFQCDRESKCSTIGLWRRLDAAIRSVVDTTTIADLVDERPDAADSYYI